MKPVAGRNWPGGYSFRPFKCRTTDHEFVFSRRSKPETSKQLRTSATAAAYNAYLQETLVQGRLQGRKRLDPKGASALCSRNMWGMALKVLAALQMPNMLYQMTGCSKVERWKKSALLKGRERVKAEVRAEALRGWIRNDGDDFEVEPA